MKATAAPFIVVLLLGFAYITAIGGLPPGVLVSGGTTLSLTQADFTSSSSFFSGKQWILTFAQGGMGQSWVGSGTKSAIGSKSGTEPGSDFYLKVDMKSEDCRFPISKDSTMAPVYVYNYEVWNKAVWETCEGTRGTRCGAGALKSLELLYDKNGGQMVPYTFCGCIGRTAVTSSLGTLKTPEVVATSTVSVSRDGSSYESKTVELGKANAQVTFNNAVGVFSGYLASGDTCDTQFSQAANQYYVFYNNGWKLGSMSYYRDYSTALQNMQTWFGTWQSDTARSAETLKNRVETLNSYEANAIKSMGGSFVNANTESTTGTSPPYFVRTLKTPISAPVWTFYVKADWLGVVQPVPRAIVTYGSSTGCKSGQGGNIQLSVKNTGEAGNVEIWATCSGSFASSYSSVSSFKSGETKSFNVPFDVNTGAAVAGTCRVCAHGNGDTATESCLNVGVSCSPQQICTPGTVICEGVGVKKCNLAGSGFEITEDCAAAGKVCQFSNGVPACVDKDGASDCAPGDLICMLKGMISRLFGSLGATFEKLAAAAIISIIVVLALYFAIPTARKIITALPIIGAVLFAILFFLLLGVV